MAYIHDSETVIAADLDDTLAESKALMHPEMANIISRWLSKNRFAVISGGKYEQFQKQVISVFPPDARLERLYLFPTNGAACYAFQNDKWVKIYEESLDEKDVRKITEAFEEAIKKSGFTFPELFGKQIERRGGEVTFSALGQEAPLLKKQKWDPDQKKRKHIVSYLVPLLPDFKVAIGGATSIDVTRKGIDKAYAISKMKEMLNVDNDHVIFLGDAIFEGGNDYPATTTGITCIKVTGPSDTIEKIESLIK